MLQMNTSSYTPESCFPGRDQRQSAADVMSQHHPAPIHEAMNPKPPSRRVKRMVADHYKDDKYWEKRKRNNDAARRSRENRRKFDLNVRTRLFVLEEENTLLRKEISVLKSKFGLLSNQRYLAMDDKGELVSYPIQTDYNILHRPDLDDESDHKYNSDQEMEETFQTTESQQYDINVRGIREPMQHHPHSPYERTDGKGSTFDSGSSPDPSDGPLSPNKTENSPRREEEIRHYSVPMKKRKQIKYEITSQSDSGHESTNDVMPMYTKGQVITPSHPSPKHSMSESSASTSVGNNYGYLSYSGQTRDNLKDQRSSQIVHESQYSRQHGAQPVQSRTDENEEGKMIERSYEMSRPRGFYAPFSGENPTEIVSSVGGFTPHGGSAANELQTPNHAFKMMRQETEVLGRASRQGGHRDSESSVAYGQTSHKNVSESDTLYQTEQQRDTDELRSRLRMLSEEVAKMKTFVMCKENK